MEVPFFKLDSAGNELRYIAEVLRSGWLTTASKAREFETRFAAEVEARHAFAVNSCTSALHLALEALGISEGSRVIVPSLTFTATAEVVRYLGAHPVFVDCEAKTGLVTKEIIARAVEAEPDIKACVVVHFSGQSAEMTGADGIEPYCRERGIKLVIDAAHAFPAGDEYGPVGSIGDATCFSFYANKTITTGEGGMVTTNDDAIADRIRVMRLHGINRDVWDRFTAKHVSWEYDVVAPGYKYNMPDVNAAIGLAQLEHAHEFRQKRQHVADQYTKAFSNQESLRIFECRVNPKQHAWHLFPIILEGSCALGRNDLIDRLNDDGIGTSVHYKPLHRMSYYREKYRLNGSDFPATEHIWQGCLSLPIYPALTDEQVTYVIDRVKLHLSIA